MLLTSNTVHSGQRTNAAMFLLHIPKTAGTTVNSMLSKVFEADKVAVHVESHPNFLQALKREGRTNWQFVSGHLRLPAILSSIDRSDWFLFTFLRNPVQHLISHLRWVKALGRPGNTELSQHEPAIQELAKELWQISLNDVDKLEDLSKQSSMGRQLFDNCQVRYLIEFRDDFISRNCTEDALHALSLFDYVGLTEKLSDFQSLMITSGIPVQEAIPVENKSPLADEQIDFGNPKVLAFYRDFVKWDAALYSAVKKQQEEYLAI